MKILLDLLVFMLKTFTNVNGKDKEDMLKLFAVINSKRAELKGKSNLSLEQCNNDLTDAL